MTARCRDPARSRGSCRYPSMEGRSRDRPMNKLHAANKAGFLPSMEGRSRDRPMLRSNRLRCHQTCALQWRGGHVTARCIVVWVVCGDNVPPSMEGRSRDRPMVILHLLIPTPRTAFNGGAVT